jgi:hypothetical protein
MQFLHDNGIISPSQTKVWEPACGDGSMSEVIKMYGYEVYSSDIRETGYGDRVCDFFKHEPIECGAIITNPPFNLSADFITRAVEVADVSAMLLKSQYWHAFKRTKLFYYLPPAYVLPLNWRPDFMNGERGNAPVMEVLWTVWIEHETDTRYRVLSKPKF